MPTRWRINTLISAEREFIIKVVGRALGEFRYELMEEIGKMIAEKVEKLRAELNLKHAGEDGEVLLCRTRCRGEAGGGNGGRGNNDVENNWLAKSTILARSRA
jgi:hypothetical protein